jgi:uncharacterized membrane protein YgdD (TMEM256/DUF423 family)
MTRAIIFGIGANGAAAVALGAFGAHGLKAKLLHSGMLSTWDTAAHYHLTHAVACLALIAWAATCPSRAIKLRWATLSWLIGCLLFAGSLYWLALGGPRLLGPITPIGGLCFLVGWILVAAEALRKEKP